jgi:hypothetical protein
MTLPINIKVRVLPRFPANVIGRTGIAVSKVNGVYYFDLNYPSVPIAPTVPTGSVPYTLMWDSVSGTYTLIPLSSFTYVEAPNDGFTYGRQSLAWSKALNLAGGTLTGNLILNADPSAALGAATKQYVDSHTSGIPSDAPSDGTIYGRRNGAWTSVMSGGAAVTISDTPPGSPVAGNLWWNSALGEMYIYYNDGSSSQWVAITTAQAVGSGGGGGGGGAGSFTTSIIGVGTYIVPSGKTTMIGEAWGGGGSGSASGFSMGGGGGGYSKFTTSVTPGQTIYYTVGAGGAAASGSSSGNNGANSWVNPSANSQPSSNGCVGGFGAGGTASPGGGGNGTIGTTNFQGGNGGVYISGPTAAGGGGGGAGSAANGSTPSPSTSGGAGGSPDGGAGGPGGVASSSATSPGLTPGGGGGGTWTVSTSGGSGGGGQVRLTFS